MTAVALCILAGGGCAVAAETTSTDPSDTAQLYLRAAQWITAISPAGSNLDYREYPPFGLEWDRMDQAAWDTNSAVRRIAHEARSSNQANWPDDKKTKYLNSCRALANDLGDAALFEHFHGNDAGAFETIKDILHLAEMLRVNPQRGHILRPLVATGIDALTVYRILVIASNVKLTNDANNAQDFQIDAAHKLIDSLLDGPNPKEEFALVALSPAGAPLLTSASTNRLQDTFSRVQTEKAFAAMSLACHIFQFENHRWPAQLDDLVPAYIGRIPIDPWGDGKETLRYALVKGGLPDGSDRPLVYSRCLSQDGLFYRVDEPQYGFSIGEGPKHREHGGQFRDVASWAPSENSHINPTTQPLN